MNYEHSRHVLSIFMSLTTISILIAMHHMLVGKILYSKTSVCNIMFQFESRASLYQENHTIETKWLSCVHSISRPHYYSM